MGCDVVFQRKTIRLNKGYSTRTPGYAPKGAKIRASQLLRGNGTVLQSVYLSVLPFHLRLTVTEESYHAYS